MSKGFKWTGWINASNQSQSMENLKDIVDNGTTYITIETPDGWKCDREGCKIDYLHEHTTYPSLNP